MQALPHNYEVIVAVGSNGDAEIMAERVPSLRSAPPAEFGGPGNLWSPETLAVAALADCFALTFRALAAASRISWSSLVCDARGTVDREQGQMRFTAMHLHASLLLPVETDVEKGRMLLEKAKRNCIIGNSLKFEPTLEMVVRSEEDVPGPIVERPLEEQPCSTSY